MLSYFDALHHASQGRISEELLPAFRAERAAAVQSNDRAHLISVTGNLASLLLDLANRVPWITEAGRQRGAQLYEECEDAAVALLSLDPGNGHARDNLRKAHRNLERRRGEWDPDFVPGQETECRYVSSRGLMKSCDVFPASPESDTRALYPHPWHALPDGAVVYVTSTALPEFLRAAAPRIPGRFTLVTGDSDAWVPAFLVEPAASGGGGLGLAEVQAFVDGPALLHWFAQNLVLPAGLEARGKLSPLPVGLDYHTLNRGGHLPRSGWGREQTPAAQEAALEGFARRAPPPARRAAVCYCNFAWQQQPLRRAAVDAIAPELVYREAGGVPREETWKAMSLTAFTLSPRGGGLDCHRTWEALVLGSVPVLKASAADPLYAGLPVLVVQDWADVTAERLAAAQREVAEGRFDLRPLTLAHWVARIRNVTAAALAGRSAPPHPEL